jgi:hypothetical protein
MKTSAERERRRNEQNVHFKGKWYTIRNEMPEVTE